MEHGNKVIILPIIYSNFLILICDLTLISYKFVINSFVFDCVIDTSIFRESIVNLKMPIFGKKV